MAGFVTQFIVGIICVVFGILNMKGDISSLHWYHRNRIAEEDRLPFGRAVGRGILICGCAILVGGVLLTAATYTNVVPLALAGGVVTVGGLGVGVVISLVAIKKYNKGIF